MSERIQLVGEIPEPRHWPLQPMKQFGTIPGREDNLFRLVWAPSVKGLVGGKFRDGFTGYKVRPSYRAVGDSWILEKWISAAECTQQTEASYNADPRNIDFETGLYKTGPYPRNGTYYLCYAFPKGERPNINIYLLTSLIKKAKLNSSAMNRKAILEATAKEEAADDARRFEQVKDLQSVGGIRPANIGGMIKKQKSMPPLQDARKFGLPTHGPAFRNAGATFTPTESQLALIGR